MDAAADAAAPRVFHSPARPTLLDTTPPPVPASLPSRPATGQLLGAFALDGVIAIAVVLGVSLAAGVVWAFYQAFLIGMASGGQVQDPASLAAGIGQPGALAQMLMALISMSAAALLLYLWRRRADAAERAASFTAARRGATWGWTVLVGAAAFVGSGLIAHLARLMGSEPVPTNLAMVEEAVQRWPVFLVLFAVVLAPLYEELLFRRVLFGRFVAAGRPWLGLVLSSLAFALIHEVPGLSANAPLAVLQLWLVYGGMGALFAWLYWRTGTLWAPIAAHALNNGLALAFHGLG